MVIFSNEVCSTFTGMSSRTLLSDHVFSTSTYVSYTIAAFMKINFHYHESLIKYKDKYFQTILYGRAVAVINRP